jgi:hypothetical protein
MLNYTESTHTLTTVPCIEQPKAAPEPPGANMQPEVLPVAGIIAIRRATIETENAHDLNEGIICGQESYVDHSYDFSSLTSHDLARLILETMQRDESEAFHMGFLIGLVDALLRARKTYPRVWYVAQKQILHG